MSIDARVVSVTMNEDGSGRLNLIDRPRRPGIPAGIAGQNCLKFTKAPTEVTALNGLCVWAGGCGEIMLGEMAIGKRDGYTSMEFYADAIFTAAVAAYHASHTSKPKPPSV